MADREEPGSASHRERSRGRSETRIRHDADPTAGDSTRLDRLEAQTTQMSETLLALGPTLQQIIQMQRPTTPVALNPGLPVEPPPAQMPIPPVNAAVPNMPEAAQPSQATATEAVNPNVSPVDPLQASDPWRNFHYSPARGAGIHDRPFPLSTPASPDRAPPPFASSTSAAVGTNIPPPPGIHEPYSNVGPHHMAINTPHGSTQGVSGEENPFKRSERWMPSVPTPSFSDWKTRPIEITGFLNWLSDLAAWTGLGSNAYPGEIMMCVKEVEPLGWHRLDANQITRSVRLLSILKVCFNNHDRASLVIKNYEESKGYSRCCGFECLRLIAREFAVKTRTELLFFRTQLANSNISAPTIPEVIRKIQSELFQYERVSQLVDPSVNIKGLEFVEADKVLLLLRALPHQCRQWVVLNSPSESFASYTECALRYEAQQRIWLDLNGKPIASLNQDSKGYKGGKGKEKKGNSKGKKADKEGKGNESPGKGKGVGNAETRTCFHCNERGHLAINCPNKPKDKSNSEKGSKGSKGEKGKMEKGKKGEKGSKGSPKGPKGKRATAFESQPESEVGSEWSEPDFEDGGRLSVFEQVATPFFICSNIEPQDPLLWLVDSGASRTVVSSDALQTYKVLRERTLQSPMQFRTASGEQVQIDHECMLEVFFPTTIEYDDWETQKIIRYEIRAVIGPVEHNLLSVSSITKMGATFSYGPEGCSIRVSDLRRMECEIWASVPWLRAHKRKTRAKDSDVEMTDSFASWSDESPMNGQQKGMSSTGFSIEESSKSDGTSSTQTTTSKSILRSHHVKALQFSSEPEVKYFEPNTMSCPTDPPIRYVKALEDRVDHPLPPVPGDDGDPHNPSKSEPGRDQIVQAEPASYDRFKKKIESELSMHRRRGHVPYDSRCVHCQRSRSVIRHARLHEQKNAPLDHKMLLIQADFFC